jgi:hypothetical protein
VAGSNLPAKKPPAKPPVDAMKGSDASATNTSTQEECRLLLQLRQQHLLRPHRPVQQQALQQH